MAEWTEWREEIVRGVGEGGAQQIIVIAKRTRPADDGSPADVQTVSAKSALLKNEAGEEDEVPTLAHLRAKVEGLKA
jgi:hypothetical protein